MFKKRITLKILIFLILTDLLETFTHYCFKKGALTESSLSVVKLADVIIFLQGVFSSPFIWIGLFSVVTTFIIWSTLLSKIDLSVAVPICSFSYILVPLTSIFFLHEKISLIRWGGIVFILIGIILVSLTSKEKVDVG